MITKKSFFSIALKAPPNSLTIGEYLAAELNEKKVLIKHLHEKLMKSLNTWFVQLN